MRSMSNDELTKHSIRTSADLLELNEKVDEIRHVQDSHTETLSRQSEILAEHSKTLAEHSKTLAGHSEILAHHSKLLADHTDRLDNLESTLKAHVANSEDHFRKTDANFLDIRNMLGDLLARRAR